MNFLKHLFLPQFSNNQRARLIHNQVLFVVALFLIGATFVVNFTKQHAPSVLGVSVNISSQDLLSITNQERAAAGLNPVQLDGQLSQAADNKARDMFAKQYWAHFAPDGKSPWDFIREAGYPYVYAGENLARGFTSSTDVTNAWMNSPEHRANVLSNNYTDVGFAIEQGPLPGDSNTVLVVEMFGSKYLAPVAPKTPPIVATVEETTPSAAPSSPSAEAVLKTPTPTVVPVLAAVKKDSLIDSAFVTKMTSLVLLSLFVLIFGLDIVLTENRKTIRLAGHSFDHLLFLIGILIIAISLGLGVVG